MKKKGILNRARTKFIIDRYSEAIDLGMEEKKIFYKKIMVKIPRDYLNKVWLG